MEDWDAEAPVTRANTGVTLSMSLAGYVWPMGQVITYVISTSSIEITPVLNVTTTNQTLTWQGGNVGFTVESHTQLTGVQGTTGTYAVPWTTTLGTYDEETGVFTAAEQIDYPWFMMAEVYGYSLSNPLQV